MERYEAYKDSGVKWLGEIPVTWTCGRIRSVYALRKELVEDGEPDELVSVSEYYGVDYRRNRISSSDVLVRADSLEGYQLCYPDDLVMNIMLAWKGAQGTSAIKGLVSPSYGVFRPLEGSCPRYYHYLMRTDQYKEYFKSYSSGIIDSRLRLYPEVFLHLNCHVPPLEEQQAIADYLDAKTAEVDALVADCEREVGLLREYRKAVISEAVTKGLDPYAPMKDSGVEWIGEIPEGWVIVPFKAIGTVAANLQHPANYPDLPQVSPDRIEKDSGRLLPCFSVAEVGVESDNHVFHAGDILYSKVRPALNKVTVAPFDGMCSADMYPIESSQNKRWLVFYMLSNAFMEQVIVSTDRVKMPKINKEELGAFKVVLPSADEQCEIAVYLDAKTTEIDSLIEAKQQMADKLREYRKSLISEAVTGKFKVQGVR